MKIIITEDQLKIAVFQNAVDMAWKDIADNIKEEDYYKPPVPNYDYDKNGNIITLEVIYNKKETLNHLVGSYVKIIEGKFSEDNPDYLFTGAEVFNWDGRDGLVTVKLNDYTPGGSMARLYPSELILDRERQNAR